MNSLPTSGLTVAAENPVYVQGNYNSTTDPTLAGSVPASILADAVTLLKAMSPKVVVVGAELRSAGSTGTAEAFNRFLDALTVVELPPDFSRRDMLVRLGA